MVTFRTRTWEECGLLWWAKGYKLDAIAPAFEQHFGPNSKLGRTTLSECAKSNKEAPPEVVEFVWSDELLPVLPDAPRLRYEVIRRGLDADTPIDLAELARSAAAPALESVQAELQRVAETIRERTDAVRDAVDAASERLNAVQGAVDAAAVKTEGKLVQLSNTIEETHDKIDKVDAKQDSTEAKVDAMRKKVTASLDRLTRAIWGGTVVMVVGFSAVLISTCQRTSTAPPATPPGPNVTVSVGVGSGAVEVVNEQSPWALPRPPGVSGNLGKRKVRLVPHKPMRHQAVAPCPGSQATLYGGCWVQTVHTAPCPPDEFQEGDACYVPVHDDSTPPQSEDDAPPTADQH